MRGKHSTHLFRKEQECSPSIGKDTLVQQGSKLKHISPATYRDVSGVDITPIVCTKLHNLPISLTFYNVPQGNLRFLHGISHSIS